MSGQAAGVGTALLLRTGRGAAQESLPLPPDMGPFQVFDSLPDALAHLFQERF